MIENIWI